MLQEKMESENFFLDDMEIRGKALDKFVDTEMPHGTVATNHNSCLSSSHYPVILNATTTDHDHGISPATNTDHEHANSL